MGKIINAKKEKESVATQEIITFSTKFITNVLEIN